MGAANRAVSMLARIAERKLEMSQPIGWPGGGIQLANGIRILCGAGVPSESTTPDVLSAGVGSIFINTTGTSMSLLYVQTPGGWVNFA